MVIICKGHIGDLDESGESTERRQQDSEIGGGLLVSPLSNSNPQMKVPLREPWDPKVGNCETPVESKTDKVHPEKARPCPDGRLTTYGPDNRPRNSSASVDLTTAPYAKGPRSHFCLCLR